MRFIQNGPSIPDELLIARDEGRVVFFCGAGVSKAKAGLVDFFGLIEKVIQNLRVAKDDQAYRVFEQVRELSLKTEAINLISVDRIFGLLERNFLSKDIELEVAKILKPSADADLSAHKTILNLARTPTGRVRIVTTNFDRLFEKCDSEVNSFIPPRLPDPSHTTELDGIVYLHGRATKNYDGAEGEGFVLSSSEFGRAYLSDGWATNFLQEIIGKYSVVFIGYKADDPPVQYLLEGLSKNVEQFQNIYAFESNASIHAAANWKSKGVNAITYNQNLNHSDLWETLELWALRATNPDEWYQSIVSLAKEKPENLQPYQRGQVAHAVSTLNGARYFSIATDPPPAEWLCVFDPDRRFGSPSHVDISNEQSEYVDPFNLYGLDSDPYPEEIDPQDFATKREKPRYAWDCFALNKFDQQVYTNESYVSARGYLSITPIYLAPRLNKIGLWLGKVCHQPTSIWWAANQTGLHPSIQRVITIEMNTLQTESASEIRKAWMYLFEIWKNTNEVFRDRMINLSRLVKSDGWSTNVVRYFVDTFKPYLKLNYNNWRQPFPPSSDENIRIQNLINLVVKYQVPRNNFVIPPDSLATVVQSFRKNIEHAVALESEIGGFELEHITPIVPNDDSNGSSINSRHGISKYMFYFATLFEQLSEHNASLAQNELANWPTEDYTVFARLRIWACGLEKVVKPEKFEEELAKVSDYAFWNHYHQRDLLVVIANRWSELPIEVQIKIEARLLKGPP